MQDQADQLLEDDTAGRELAAAVLAAVQLRAAQTAAGSSSSTSVLSQQQLQQQLQQEQHEHEHYQQQQSGEQHALSGGDDSNVTANAGSVDSQVCIITMALATVMLCMFIAVLSSFIIRYMCVCSVIDQIVAAQLCRLPVVICMQCAPVACIHVLLQLQLNESFECLC
jgi:hypothetical protein